MVLPLRVLRELCQPLGAGHVKDSLWSVDLFRCESILLRSHWVMVAAFWITVRAAKPNP
jgi:hypothetical protein